VRKPASIFAHHRRLRFGPSAKPRGDFHARNNRAADFPARIGALEMRRSLQIFWQRVMPCMLQTQNCAAAKILRGVKFCIVRTAQMQCFKKN